MTQLDGDDAPVAAIRRAVLDQSVPVYRFLLGMTAEVATAEDLLQDTILRAWERAGTLKDTTRARVWVFAIATNVVRSHMRRKRRVSWIPLDLLGDVPDPRAVVSESSDVADCIGRMRQQDREIVMLVAHAGFSVNQSAEILGISTAAAEKRWQRSRDKLRSLLEGEQP